MSTLRASFFRFVYLVQRGEGSFEEERKHETEEATLSRYFVGFVCSTQSVVSHRSLPSRLARERFQSNSDFSSFKRHASIPNIIYIMSGVVRIYLVAKLCASGRVRKRFSRRMYESCELIEVVVAGLVSPFVFFHFWEKFKIFESIKRREQGWIIVDRSSILFDPVFYNIYFESLSSVKGKEEIFFLKRILINQNRFMKMINHHWLPSAVRVRMRIIQNKINKIAS